MTDVNFIATIVGTDVAAISIIIVYHLFALQTWTERGHGILDGAIQLSLTSAPEDLQREDLRNRAGTWFKQFPWWQVGILGVAVLGMCALGLYAGGAAGSKSTWLLVAAPLLVLVLVYAASSVLVWTQGRSVLRQTHGYLGAQ